MTTGGDIIPAPNPGIVDHLAAWTDIAIRYAPRFHEALVRRLIGPAFTALELAYADGLLNVRQAFDLEVRGLTAQLEAANERATNYELRVNELQADDEAVAAVRKLYADRLERVDKRFAECRTNLARCEKERTAQAAYAVKLEDRIRELESTTP